MIDEVMEQPTRLQTLFANLPSDIKARCGVKRFNPGCIVFKRKDSLKHVYLLIEGELKVVNESENGNIYVFGGILPLSFVGELEVLAEEKEYAATIEAIVECTLIQINAGDFSRWLECDASVLMMVAKGLAQKMYPTSAEVMNIMRQPSLNKVEYYIAKYCDGKINTTEWIKVEKSRQQIADEIGSSIKSVNRGIKKLKEEGLIAIKRGKIYVNPNQHIRLLEAIRLGSKHSR